MKFAKFEASFKLRDVNMSQESKRLPAIELLSILLEYDAALQTGDTSAFGARWGAQLCTERNILAGLCGIRPCKKWLLFITDFIDLDLFDTAKTTLISQIASVHGACGDMLRQANGLLMEHVIVFSAAIFLILLIFIPQTICLHFRSNFGWSILYVGRYVWIPSILLSCSLRHRRATAWLSRQPISPSHQTPTTSMLPPKGNLLYVDKYKQNSHCFATQYKRCSQLRKVLKTNHSQSIPRTRSSRTMNIAHTFACTLI